MAFCLDGRGVRRVLATDPERRCCMMPIRPFWWDVLGLLLCLAGFALLALAAEREGHVLLRRKSFARERLLYRLLGWPLLVAGLALSVAGWRGNFGPYLWFGWLTVTALVVVFAISYWPWRAQPHRPHGRHGEAKCAITVATSAVWVRIWGCFLLFFLLALPVGFGWALAHAPVHPLLRADAVQGQVGPWAFTLVEEDEGEPPEDTPSGVMVKHLMLRFCDVCDADIRAAYVQLRKPASARSLGIRFVGKRWEREATLPVPAAITAQDQLWLTVLGKDGQVYRTALEVAQVSPALAQFIEEKNP